MPSIRKDLDDELRKLLDELQEKAFYGFDFAADIKKPRGHQEYAENIRADFDWSDSGMEREYRSAGRKHFPAATIAGASTPYFYEWAATRLGISYDAAKTITQQRLAGHPPSDIARDIARHSTISEVRSSCETYINDLK